MLSWPQEVNAQKLLIQGKILSQSDNTPIAFAHISICGTGIGTSSNEVGDFRISFDSLYLSESLCITSIGYDRQELSIAELIQNPQLRIKLTPNVLSLPEVLVTGEKIPTAEKLLRKAIQRISKNYPINPHVLEAYYREYLEDDLEFQNVREAAVSVYDPGFLFADNLIRLKIYQSRYSEKYPLQYDELYENNLGGRSGNIKVVGGNELSVLMYNNPLRNHERVSDTKTGYELDEDFFKGHDMEVLYIAEMNGDKIYCIGVEGNYKHRQFENLRRSRNLDRAYKMEGKIFIREKDFGIIKFEYRIWDTSQAQHQLINELNMEYQDWQGKLYLNYLSFSNSINLVDDLQKMRFTHARELFVNNLRTRNLPNRDTYYLFNRIEQLFDQAYLREPSFWEEYNMILRKDVN